MKDVFSIGGCPANKQLFTGSGNCDVKKGYIKSLLLTKVNARYDVPADGNMDAIIAESLALPFNHPNKMWIINDIVTNGAPEGGDNITSSMGERGGSRITGQNPMSVTYSVLQSVCRQAALLKFKGLNLRMFEIDENNKVFGVGEQIGDVNTFKGFKVSLWVTTTPATASADALININFAHDLHFFAKEEPLQSNLELTILPEALLPVKLVKSGLGRAKVIMPCSGENIGERMGSLLDNTAFISKSGVPFTIAYDEATGEYFFGTTTDIPFENIDSFKLAPVATLALLNVFDIEGIEEYANLDSVPTAEKTLKLVKVDGGKALIHTTATPAENLGEKIGNSFTKAAFIKEDGTDFNVSYDAETDIYTFWTVDAVPVRDGGKYRIADKAAIEALGIYGVKGDEAFTDLFIPMVTIGLDRVEGGKALVMSREVPAENIGLELGNQLTKDAFIHENGDDFTVSCDELTGVYTFMTVGAYPVLSEGSFRVADKDAIRALYLVGLQGEEVFVNLTIPVVEAGLVRVEEGIAKVMTKVAPIEQANRVFPKEAFINEDGDDFTVTYDETLGQYTFMTTDLVPILSEGKYRLADKADLIAIGITGWNGENVFVELDLIPTIVTLNRVDEGTAQVVLVGVSPEEQAPLEFPAAAFVHENGDDFTVAYDELTGIYTFMTTDAIPVLSEGGFKLGDKAALVALGIRGWAGENVFVVLDKTPITAMLVKVSEGVAHVVNADEPTEDMGEVYGADLVAAAFINEAGDDFTVTYDAASHEYTFMTVDTVPVLSEGSYRVADRAELVALGVIGLKGSETFVPLTA